MDPHAVGSYWDLAADEHLDTFADVRTRVGNNIAGLFVLAGEASTPRRHVLDPAIYREAASRLDATSPSPSSTAVPHSTRRSPRRCCATSTR